MELASTTAGVLSYSARSASVFRGSETGSCLIIPWLCCELYIVRKRDKPHTISLPTGKSKNVKFQEIFVLLLLNQYLAYVFHARCH